MDSLAALTYPSFNVIVLDNGSTDDSPTRLRNHTIPRAIH
ncbi:MAG TPA: hypothetical protein ENH40_03280 [Nitrospirae bacterium]|nr:hypothetical protein [Nitrospirota bacterium]